MSSPFEAGSVRFSRVLRLPQLIALGSSAMVGVSVYTLLSIFGQYLDTDDAVGPYLLMGLIAIPIVLTLAERSSVIPGSGGLYRIAANSGTLWVTYFSGWMMLAGYLTLSAVLGWGVALSVDLLIRELFGLVIDIRWIAAGSLGLVAINSLSMINTRWRTRAALVYASLIYLIVLGTRNLIAVKLANIATVSVPRTIDLFTVAAIMACGLWGLDYIMSVRDLVQRPTRTMLPAMGLTVSVGVALGAFIAVAFRGVDLSGSLTPLIDLATDARILPDRLVALVYAVFALFITLIALNRAFLNGRNLLFAMSRDGYLPALMTRGRSLRGVPLVISFLIPLGGILLVLVAPIELIAALAALTFLWAVSLVHLPDLLRSAPKLPTTQLPFHPLFPGLTLATGFLVSFALGGRTLAVGGLWLALGGLYYLRAGRQRSLEIRREQVVISEDTAVQPKESGYRVMAEISGAKHPVELIRTAAAVAEQRGGDLLVLNTLHMREQIPPHLRQARARALWEHTSEVLEEAEIRGPIAQPLVRLAPNVIDGILEAVEEEQVDLLLIEWSSPDNSEEAQALDRILRTAAVEVAIVRGQLPATFDQLVVATSGGPHAPAALKLARELAKRGGGQIRLTNVVPGGLTPDSEAEAIAKIQSTREAAADVPETESRVLAAPTAWEGILSEAEDADVLLVGTTEEGILERPQFGGIPSRVAQAASVPTIITRARESKSAIRLQRIWGAISDPLPKLSLQQHVAVAQSMRDAAIPTIDFYILIGLAAGIASLGLLQNSGAVIIGAMLVAPLMSPILAMGMSLVLVEFRVLRTAAEATIKGVALAILVGVVMVILSPIKEPTAEILARTEPNILDLMVALLSGAAAGYALSRKEVAAAMPGVAIAAALVPPLCVVGYGIAVSDLSISAGALLLFTTNLIAIVLAAAVTFLALGFKPERTERGELAKGLRITAISLVVVFVILAFATVEAVSQQKREDEIARLFEQQVVAQVGRLEEMNIQRRGNGYLLTATIISYTGQQLTPDELGQLEDDISEAAGGRVSLDATFLAAERLITELGGLDRLRLLEQVFEEQISAAELELVNVQAAEVADGYLVEAAVIVTGPRPLTVENLSAIQAELETAVEDTVELHVVSLSGDRTELPGN